MDEKKAPLCRGPVVDPILDGATADPSILNSIPPEVLAAAADLSRPLEERLEAFEDIMESEVGDTAFFRARNMERHYGLRQLYLKFEGNNPTGTQKDRIAFAQAMDALRRGFDGITIATCGNYGSAMALAASLCGLRCLIYIPASYHTSRVEEMSRLGAEIVRVEGDYETAVEKSQEHAEREELFDGNPGGANTLLQLQAYGQIAYEIYDELREAPRAVAVSVSNGTTLAGLYRGFQSLHRRGKSSRMPIMVAGSTFRKNPIVRAWRQNLERCEDLRRESVRETPINEPLVNWKSLDGDYALQALKQTGGWAGDATDRAMRECARELKEKEGMNVLPASTAGLVALLEHHKKDPLLPDRYVAVITGKR